MTKWRSIKEDGSPFVPDEHPSILCLRTGKPQYNKIMGIHRPNGELRWIQINSSPIFDNKEVRRTVTTFNDITEMINLKKNMELNKFRMEVAIEALRFGIWDWDITNNVLVWDDYMYQIFGAKKENFTGAYEAFEACLDPSDKDRFRQNVDIAIAKGNQIFESEFHVIRPIDQQRRLIKAVSKVLRYDNIVRMIGVNYDITEERQAEAMIHQTAKVYSLGEMAAGVAHEINNPLAIISGRITQIDQMTKGNKVDAEKLKEYSNSIKNTSNRMATIVKGLLNFSRDGSKDNKEVFNIVSTIEEALSFCQGRLLHKEIKLQFDSSKIINVSARSNDISQIVINLLNNSIDVLSNTKEKWIKVEFVEDKNNIKIIFSVSGIGVKSEIKNQIFDPFFTTKEAGKGTGLGLSISKGLAQRNNGDLELIDTEGYTSFKLTLKKP